MKDQSKTSQGLSLSRQKIAELEKSESEHKNVERVLKEREATIRVLMDSPVDSVLLVNTDGIILESNKTFAERMGRSIEELIGMCAYDLFPSELAEKRRARIEEVVRLGVPIRHQDVRDGICLDHSVYPVFDTQGNVAKIAIIARDITEHKRAEEALRLSEENFRRSLDNSPLGVRIVTIEGETIYANLAILDIYGYHSIEELTITPIKKRYTPESYAEFQIRKEKRKRGYDPSEYEISIVRKDGKVRNLKVFRKDVLWNGERQFQVVYQDITERNRLEERLRKSEEQFRVAQEFSPDGFTILRPVRDAQGQIIDFTWVYENAAIARLNGTDPKIVVGQRLLELFPGHRNSPFLIAYKRVAETGEHCTFEESYHGETISKRDWFRIVVVPAGGDIAILAQDITERKQVEDKLKESELRFRNSFNLPLIGFAITSPEKGWIETNDKICSILGYSREELFQKTWLELTYPDDLKADVELFNLLLSGQIEQYSLDKRFIRKDGVVVWTRISVGCVRELDGKVNYIIGLMEDITDRNRAEAELKESESKYRNLINQAWDAIFVIDSTGKMQLVNEQACKMLGYTQEELLRLNVADTYPVEERAIAAQRIATVQQGDHLRYERSMVRKDGTFFLVEVAIGMLPNGMIQGIVRDITERKQAEEGLRASRERMRALGRRLQEAREEERTDIAREIHDELGGALTGMKVDVSFLIKSALKIKNEAARTSLLAGMDSVTKSIDTTINTVRRISMELRPGILDDLGLVAALKWQLNDFEKRTGIRCEFFPPVEDISLDTDLSTALFRIFQEALTNVARHSGATEVRVRLRADADSSALEVEDNGKGIEKEKTPSSKSLGLLGMRERAQMFGGRITVTGTPGTGTTVTVEISSVEKGKMDRDQKGAAG